MPQDTLLSLAALPVFPLFTPDGNRKARCTDGGKLAGLLQIRNGSFAFRTRLGTEFDVPLAAVEKVSVPAGAMMRFPPAGSELICTVEGKTYRFGPTAPLHPDVPVDQLLQAIQPQKAWKSIGGEFMKSMHEIAAVAMLEPALGVFSAVLDFGFERMTDEIARKAGAESDLLKGTLAQFLAHAPAFAPGVAFRDRLLQRTALSEP